ncbi:MAG TPA: glycine zipper 2TM domain-containing protein [Burkholderiaceae bacterium]|mgnify:CR=1 FL=1|nr:glycine zipper 2TM domain-containing protein [Burkholderiaceae bacterium]
MKKTVILLALAGTAGLSAAQEMGRVISSIPVVNQVGVPRQVCTTEAVPVQSQKSGAGAVIGGIAGGAMGNAIGGGSGRAAATILGVLGGAVLGDRIEGSGPTQIQNVQNCTTQTFYENRTTAYNVVYEYAGKQYSVQMPSDPGPYVKLQISPVGASQPQAPLADGTQPYYQQELAQPQQQVITQQPVYVAVQPPVYPTYYYPRAYYPPVGVNLNLGWSRGHYGHGHWR